MKLRRLAKRYNTTDPLTFIEVTASYNKPPDYVNDRLPSMPYYLVSVVPVKIEGSFEIRTAYTGYKATHAAPARFSQKAMQEFFDVLADGSVGR
jgi:uncharacterized membrane protein (UPF0182 family)